MHEGQAASRSVIEPKFKLRTLGPLELVVIAADGSERIVSAGGKPLALLAYIVCCSKRSASRERLAGLLWAASDSESAFQSIRQARSSLKRLTGEDLVLLDGTTLTLAPCVRSDRDKFRRSLAQDSLTQAIELYRGAFCESFAAPGADEFERWAEGERSALRSRCTEAIARLAAEALSEARATDALALARRLSAVDADDERHWRIHLEALLLKHDAFSAAVVSTECQAWLKEEGREASRALLLLLDRIANVRKDDSPDNSKGSEPGYGLYPDLIGRENQFGALLNAWREVGEGHSRCVLLVGDAGLGKTRLLHDVHERLIANRARVVAIRALPTDSEIRFALVSRLAAALASMRGAAGLSETSASILLGLNPSLAAHFRSVRASAPSTDPLLSYIEALDELLGILTEERRLALMIDDLHWSDAESAQILASLGERHADRRLLLLLATRGRSGNLPRTPSGALVLGVDPLSMEETDSLLGSIAPLGEASASDWRLCLHKATEGNPLLILETLRHALDAGWLTIDAEGWRLSDAQALLAMLPQRTVMQDRLSRLDRNVKHIALCLAVSGRPLPATALADTMTTWDSDGASAMLTLEVHDIAARDADGWVIAHDALAETLIASCTERELKAARTFVARVLRRAGDAPHLRGALHQFVSLRDWEECADVVTRIARSGESGGEAARRRVAMTLSTLPTVAERADIRRRLPWSLRYPVRTIGAVCAFLFAVAVIAFVWPTHRPSDAPPPAQLVAFGAGDDGSVDARAISLDLAFFSSTSPIDLSHAPMVANWATTGVHAASIGRADGPSAVERFYQDSGGVDVALRYPDGHEERLTSTRGDDVPIAWAPDGSALLIESSRWGELGHDAIIALDMKTREVRRISSGGSRAFSDASPSWSPDGSRIAFVRKHFDVRPSDLCIVDSDGQRERCTALPGRSALETTGWLDAKRLVVWVDSSDTRQTVIVSMRDNSIQSVLPGRQECTVSPDGIWWACHVAGTDSLSIAPVASPQSRRLLLPPNSVRHMFFAWRPSARPTRVIARLEVSSPIHVLPIGVGTALHAEAIAATGERVTDVGLRWTLGDSSQGTISSDGVLVPARPGAIVVHVTAGGWRSAELRLQAEPTSSTVVAREGWDSDFERRWRVFGTPLPAVTQEAGRQAFWNRGDGDHFSGAFMRTSLSAVGGFWVEAAFKTPITTTQWQTSEMEIRSLDRRAHEKWDPGAGAAPDGQMWCNFGYPEGEGYSALRSTTPGGNISRRLGYPTDSLGRGGWYSVLLQLLPDGRCAIAIDGKPVYLDAAPPRPTPPDSVTINIEGNSFSTRILVGPLTIGHGVRTDIPWQRVAEPSPR
jgi:DNA-binding SARP family transcriptional activator